MSENQESIYGPKLTAQELIDFLLESYAANQPVMIWGYPGGGKSSVLQLVAKMLRKLIYDIRVSQIESFELRGLPRINAAGHTEWCTPEFMPVKEGGIINLEEINSGERGVLSALYQLVLDRRLGEYVLPADTWVVATGNREGDRSIVNRMPVALELRFAHCELIFDPKCMEKFLIDNDCPLEMVAWNRFRPDRMAAYDPASPYKGKPVPRQWVSAGRYVVEYHKHKDLDKLQRGVSSCVGEPDAIEFTSFVDDYKHLPDPRKVLSDPGKAKIPTKLSVLVALTTALAKLVNKETIDGFFTYAERLMADSYTEHATAMVRDALSRTEALKETMAYSKWNVRYGRLYA